MSPTRIDQSRPFLTLGIVIVLWVLLPTACKRWGRATFFEFGAPVETTASHVRDLQVFWDLRTRTNRELIEAGRDLSQITAAYAVRLEQNDALRKEIARLEALLRLPPLPGYRAIAARVVRREFSGWWQQLVIRKGRLDGVVEGAPVVHAGGVVGRVRVVHLYTSVVELIGSPGMRISAMLEDDDRPLSFQGGDNPTLGPARAMLELVPADVLASTETPRRVVTSGLGGVFPPRLTLGQLVRVDLSSDGLFKTGSVALDPALGTLSEVAVWVPLAANGEK